jgi:hypothetical protein
MEMQEKEFTMTQTSTTNEIDFNAWRINRKQTEARQQEINKQLSERRHQQTVRIN